jgi:hypothetical protein
VQANYKKEADKRSEREKECFSPTYLHELLVVDLSVTIHISFTDHLIDFLVSELLTEVGHDVAQFSSRNESIAILVEHTECFLDFFLRICVLHLASHKGEELREINGAIAISIDLVDHILKFSLSGVLSKRAHDCPKFLGGDGSVTILIEEGESLLEFSDLFLSESVRLSIQKHEKLSIGRKIYQTKSKRVTKSASSTTHFEHVLNDRETKNPQKK